MDERQRMIQEVDNVAGMINSLHTILSDPRNQDDYRRMRRALLHWYADWLAVLMEENEAHE